ncbi:MAG TPA: methanogenesis marker 12 protein [Methanotrichaceae archaeon]|nr:methanogenesis marker 12 protein [Methanotrichaceae archaeon]
MFIGVDHGTTAIRFATSSGQCAELPRVDASRLSSVEIVDFLLGHLGQEKVDLLALSYSMGDGLDKIVRLEDAPNRGLLQQDGAGSHVGGGTRVFEAMRSTGWPAILLPGIHRRSNIDPRLKVFSHGMSPEKVGLAYSIFRSGISDFVVCDASSNTVTFGIINGRIVGAIDAPIFAPGLIQGPLDVEAIRRVDAGIMTANQAFSCGGILTKLGQKSLQKCDESTRSFALESLALFAAMEISAFMVLLRDLGSPEPTLYLAGSPAGLIQGRVSNLLGREVQPLAGCSAARGCAMIAEDVYHGAVEVLGLEVDLRARRPGR